MKFYRLSYFYVTSETIQGWGSVGPLTFLGDKPTVEELDELQTLLCNKYSYQNCVVLGCIEVNVSEDTVKQVKDKLGSVENS